MILRRYGSSFQSVELNFDARALSEIGFRRDRQQSIPQDVFDKTYQEVSTHSLGGTAEGDVHDAVEQAALDQLRDQVEEILAAMGEGQVLVILSEQGVDYPKTRAHQKTIVVRAQNRLHFKVRIEPELRVGVYQPRA